MRILPAFAALALLAVAPAYAASPAEGLWRSPTHNGEILISTCDQGALCGKLVTSDRIKADPNIADVLNKDASLRPRLLKDMPMLNGFTGGPTEWKGGSVYNPDDGGTYKGSIKQVDANTLKLTGCIVWPLCKTETWVRIR